MGRRVGVGATLPTTLEPTVALVKSKAVAAGKEISLLTRLCAGAFEAAQSGDTARHDAIVAAGVKELSERVDVVVLAQASMARATAGLAEGAGQVPILSSPRLAIEHLARVIRDPQG